MSERNDFDPDSLPVERFTPEELLPNYARWLKYDVWSLEEAICILLNVDPEMRAYGSQVQGFNESYSETLMVASKAEGRTLTFETPSEQTDPEYCGYIFLGRVLPKTFITWAKQKDYKIPGRLLYLLDDAEENTATEESTAPTYNLAPELQQELNSLSHAVDKRVAVIIFLGRIWFNDIMKIPYKGKTRLQETLCSFMPDLFKESTFMKAWQQAKRDKKLQVDNVEQYTTYK